MQPPLPKIDEEFFRKYGIMPCATTFTQWKKFVLDHPRAKDRRRYVRSLALCAGVTDALVEHWLSARILRYKRIGRNHVAIFQAATLALGWSLPRTIAADAGTQSARQRGPARLSLFTSLTTVSDPFHLAVIRSIVRAAETQNFLLSVHELPWTHPASGEAAKLAELVVTKYAPDAVVFFRLTPSPHLLRGLALGERPVLSVLIHADRQNYPAPILANVVPDVQFVVRDLSGWLWSRPHVRKRRALKAVIVAMPKEREHKLFAKLPGIPRSIRNHRIETIERSLEGFKVTHIEVPDYSFRHALRVWRLQRDADVYVCLSDQLAVALKHLMLCGGYSEEECRHRIVGFDGSPAAREEGIVSLSQELDEIGERALRCVRESVLSTEGERPPLPDFAREILIPVRLANSG